VRGPNDALVEEAVALIRERSSLVPAAALVLGSGLGDSVGADLEREHEYTFQSLAGFPTPTVPGHAGRLVLGWLYDLPVAVFQGRIHLYEGYGIAATTLIPRVAAALGARTLVLTNAAGGLNPSLRVGQLMLLEDHINMLGVNPLTGWRFANGQPAFVDLSHVYDPGLRARALEAAAQAGIDLARGVYVSLSGPSFETPAETRFLARAGADAVGMSTVPEAVAGVALGLSILGISCVTNVAGAEAMHEDVLAVGKVASPDLQAILKGVLPAIAGSNR
jgi:purine-nucleoside phosphorylase